METGRQVFYTPLFFTTSDFSLVAVENNYRPVKIGLQYRLTIIGIIVCSLLVAVFWGANIGTIYPLVEVVFQGKSVPNYLENEIQTLDTAIAEKQILVATWKTKNHTNHTKSKKKKNPKPGDGLVIGENEIIIPDIIMTKREEIWVIQLNDGSSIWNRYLIQTGVVDIFGFAINLKWTNFPIKGSFLPFIHYLLYSNSTNTDNLFNRTGEEFKHTPSEYYMNTIYHLQPNGKKYILIPDKNNTLTVDVLSQPGYHELESDNHTIYKTAVNIAKDELQSHTLDINDTRNHLPNNINIIPITSDFIPNIEQDRIGTELWRYFLYASILLLILEMILSNAKKHA